MMIIFTFFKAVLDHVYTLPIPSMTKLLQLWSVYNARKINCAVEKGTVLTDYWEQLTREVDPSHFVTDPKFCRYDINGVLWAAPITVDRLLACFCPHRL